MFGLLFGPCEVIIMQTTCSISVRQTFVLINIYIFFYLCIYNLPQMNSVLTFYTYARKTYQISMMINLPVYTLILKEAPSNMVKVLKQMSCIGLWSSLWISRRDYGDYDRCLNLQFSILFICYVCNASESSYWGFFWML